jgi:hypothetical protein
MSARPVPSGDIFGDRPRTARLRFSGTDGFAKAGQGVIVAEKPAALTGERIIEEPTSPCRAFRTSFEKRDEIGRQLVVTNPPSHGRAFLSIWVITPRRITQVLKLLIITDLSSRLASMTIKVERCGPPTSRLMDDYGSSLSLLVASS